MEEIIFSPYKEIHGIQRYYIQNKLVQVGHEFLIFNNKTNLLLNFTLKTIEKLSKLKLKNCKDTKEPTLEQIVLSIVIAISPSREQQFFYYYF